MKRSHVGPAERLWKRVEKQQGGCWIWLGCLVKGYGHIKVGKGKQKKTHHLSLELHGLEITDGMCVDHVCRNRACCNPAHLRVVTVRQNVTENSDGFAAKNKSKTHCNRGHEFTPENTIHRLDRPRHRECRTCRPLYRLKAKAAP